MALRITCLLLEVVRIPLEHLVHLFRKEPGVLMLLSVQTQSNS